LTATEAHERLQVLDGLPLRRLGRAADMLWAQFGELRPSVSPLGRARTVGEWALHVQCSWRLCRPGQIALAYRDFFYDADGHALAHWDELGSSLFDLLASRLNDEWANASPRVASVSGDDVGGFSIRFSDAHRLDVFPCASGAQGEHWRLFRPDVDESHY